MNTGAIDAVLARYPEPDRGQVLPILEDVQDVAGHLSKDVLTYVGERIKVPVAELYGVVTFYTMLTTEPRGRHHIQVCDGPVCELFGAGEVLAAVRDATGARGDGPSPDGAFSVEAVPCLGACDRCPAMVVDRDDHMGVRPADILALLGRYGRDEAVSPTFRPSATNARSHPRVVMSGCGVGDPASLEDYRSHGGFAALEKALERMTPEEIIGEVKASELVGRGGAAFPTGLKWEGGANAPGDPKYVICNADESEPGTFKDRMLLESAPFRVLEAMAICARAIGARGGYVYIRGEYPKAIDRMSHAIGAAYEANLLGERILGSEMRFDVELRKGAGAYICGEETALFASIEGGRGEPRAKPPFPTVAGLWQKPTVINNVETFSAIPAIIQNGGAWYTGFGVERSRGTRLFCLSGHIARPGVYEVEMGMPLRKLVEEIGGGITGGGKLGGILMGGAAGSFIGSEHLDVPLTHQDLAAIGSTLGSGAVMVFDDGVDLWRVALNLARFFRHESCGKCFPCQLGTQRQVELVERLAGGDGTREDAELVTELGLMMRDASLCGLGQTAANPILSLLERQGAPGAA
jgi:NADH-quinone oxidoreductase subunit F